MFIKINDVSLLMLLSFEIRETVNSWRWMAHFARSVACNAQRVIMLLVSKADNIAQLSRHAMCTTAVFISLTITITITKTIDLKFDYYAHAAIIRPRHTRMLLTNVSSWQFYDYKCCVLYPTATCVYHTQAASGSKYYFIIYRLCGLSWGRHNMTPPLQLVNCRAFSLKFPVHVSDAGHRIPSVYQVWSS